VLPFLFLIWVIDDGFVIFSPFIDESFALDYKWSLLDLDFGFVEGNIDEYQPHQVR